MLDAAGYEKVISKQKHPDVSGRWFTLRFTMATTQARQGRGWTLKEVFELMIQRLDLVVRVPRRWQIFMLWRGEKVHVGGDIVACDASAI